jgi:hypothetical protein
MQLPGHPRRGRWLLSVRNNRDFDEDLAVLDVARSTKLWWNQVTVWEKADTTEPKVDVVIARAASVDSPAPRGVVLGPFMTLGG